MICLDFTTGSGKLSPVFFIFHSDDAPCGIITEAQRRLIMQSRYFVVYSIRIEEVFSSQFYISLLIQLFVLNHVVCRAAFIRLGIIPYQIQEIIKPSSHFFHSDF